MSLLHRPSRPRLERLLPAVAVAFACAKRPTEAPTVAASEPVAAAPIVDEPAPIVATPTSLELARALHPRAMTEVILDPRGEAAITLDVDGGARLWPDLRGDAPGLPLVLPLTEPAWITLARAGDQRWVIAAIDTAGATLVAEVEVTAGGPVWRPLFAWPATEIQLEIHVLDGGERLLALGLDHRLRLVDRAGEALATLDAPGFIPWQLRLAHHAEGPPKLVAILAGPVRAQPITIAGDTLAITGEARRIDLDRGPNRNDVILAPDGAFVTSLRRPRAEGKAWSLELIDLASDERRWIAGDVDGTVRPRLHLLSPTEALLEAGTGKGHRVDLTKARAARPGEKIDRKKLPKTRTEVIAIAGSTEDSRMLGDLAGGVRAFAVGHELFVEPVLGGPGRRLGAAHFGPSEVALDPAGERVAWIEGAEVLVEVPGEAASLRKIVELTDEPRALAFLGRDHLVAADRAGDVRLLRWEGGDAIDSTTAALGGGVVAASVHVEGDGRGVIALVGKRHDAPIQRIDVTAAGFSRPQALAAEERAQWLEFSPRSRNDTRDLTVALGLDDAWKERQVSRGAVIGDRRYLSFTYDEAHVHQLRRGEQRSFELTDAVTQIVPAPGRARIAVVESHRLTTFAAVSVVDFEGEAPRRLWTRAFAPERVDLCWSEDGSRLAIAVEHDGGHVLDGASGATIFERRHRDFAVEAISRDPAARSGSARSSG